MKFLNDGNVVRLPIADIVIGARLREANETQVENLLQMAEDTGITTPIHCRKVQGRYELIDGAHRLEVAKRLGLIDIAALIVECRQDEARAMEASNNLGAARMSPLQTAVFAASWKKDYYAMHPERKPGVFKGNRHTGNLVGEETSLTRSVAQSFAISERRARQILAVGERLTVEEAKLLAGAAKPIAMEHLADMAKIGDPGERRFVVEALAQGSAKRTNEARKLWKAREGGIESPVKDPVAEAFKALQSAWSRAPMAAKRQFIDDNFSDLENLLDDRRDDGRVRGIAAA